MFTERWDEIKEKLLTALELQPTERSTYLDQIGATDPDLRKELDSLIASHERTGTDFLNTPLAELSSILSTRDRRNSLLGQRLGPYQIIEEIGIGGMGEVYRAIRADDEYQKQVAIKLVHAGQNSDFVINRFKEERQILAGLDHPNIARLLDGGKTQHGVPYYVMELIEGQPIDDYCSEHKLPISDRVKLFLQVCAAVQYAHQRMIIHRDIKPSNILVTADGVPKLLDFGIAKILGAGAGQALHEPTLTIFRVLTPGYASPEQIRGESIGSTSDVYSLGVVLYELLTGSSPYQVAGRIPHELSRAACESEPEQPSSAVRRAHNDGNGSQASTSAQDAMVRQTSPEDLSKRLRGDLDNIVLKALRKNPEARYSSVDEFTRDLDNHLRHLPVKARPHSLTYRASKFAQRHKTAAGALGAAIALTAVAIAALLTLKNAPLENRNPTPLMLTANLGQTQIRRPVISRDGNYLAYTDSNGLHVLAIASGEVRLLRPEGNWLASDWLPNGTELLADEVFRNEPNVWKISALTGASELFRNESNYAHVSPDGSTIEFGHGNWNELWLKGADEQEAHRIAHVDSPETFLYFSWAPGSNHFVDIRGRLLGGHWEPVLEIRSLNDGESVPLVSDLRLSGRDGERGVAWLKDGRIVYVMREDPPNQNNDNLWQLHVDQRTGQIRGKPQRLTTWTGFEINDLSASLDGRRLAFNTIRNLDTVYVAKIGSGDARLSEVQRLTNDNWNSWATAWSADSTTIFYKSERHGNWGIFKQDIRQRTAEALVSGADSYSWFDLSPDGTWLMGDAYSPYPIVGRLLRIPAGGGKPEAVWSGPSIKHQCASFPANRCVLAEYGNKEMSFSLLDPTKGRGEHLVTLSMGAAPHFPDYYWALSRDGEHIAVANVIEDAIQIIEIATRSVRVLPLEVAPVLGSASSVSWSADSRRIFVTSRSAGESPSSVLLSLDLHGNAHVMLELNSGFIYCPVPSPDGRMLAFTERIQENTAAMIEHF